jgi:hypothetical protein
MLNRFEFCANGIVKPKYEGGGGKRVAIGRERKQLGMDVRQVPT